MVRLLMPKMGVALSKIKKANKSYKEKFSSADGGFGLQTFLIELDFFVVKKSHVDVTCDL